jgi:hypothetical protein
MKTEAKTKQPLATASAERAALLKGFDALPDTALVDVPTSAAVMGKGESTFWKDAKDRPDHPKVIKLSTRCARVQVGDLRRYLAAVGATCSRAHAAS